MHSVEADVIYEHGNNKLRYSHVDKFTIFLNPYIRSVYYETLQSEETKTKNDVLIDQNICHNKLPLTLFNSIVHLLN